MPFTSGTDVASVQPNTFLLLRKLQKSETSVLNCWITFNTRQLEGILDDNVIEIVGKQFSIEQDVKEFIKEIGEADPFSSHKVHLQTLLAEVCANDKASDELRQMAARALIASSDLGPAIRAVPNYQVLVQEFMESLTENVSVRR